MNNIEYGILTEEEIWQSFCPSSAALLSEKPKKSFTPYKRSPRKTAAAPVEEKEKKPRRVSNLSRQERIDKRECRAVRCSERNKLMAEKSQVRAVNAGARLDRAKERLEKALNNAKAWKLRLKEEKGSASSRDKERAKRAEEKAKRLQDRIVRTQEKAERAEDKARSRRPLLAPGADTRKMPKTRYRTPTAKRSRKASQESTPSKTRTSSTEYARLEDSRDEDRNPITPAPKRYKESLVERLSREDPSIVPYTPKRVTPTHCKVIRLQTRYWSKIDQLSKEIGAYLNDHDLAYKRNRSKGVKDEAVDYIVNRSCMSGMFRFIGVSGSELFYDMFATKIWKFYVTRGLRALCRFVYSLYVCCYYEEELIHDCKGKRVVDMFEAFGKRTPDAREAFFAILHRREDEIDKYTNVKVDAFLGGIESRLDVYDRSTTATLLSREQPFAASVCLVLLIRHFHPEKYPLEYQVERNEWIDFARSNKQAILLEASREVGTFNAINNMTYEQCKLAFLVTKRQVRKARKEFIRGKKSQYSQILKGGVLKNPRSCIEVGMQSAEEFYEGKRLLIKSTNPDFYYSDACRRECVRKLWEEFKNADLTTVEKHSKFLEEIHRHFPGETPMHILKCYTEFTFHYVEPKDRWETERVIFELMGAVSDTLLLRSIIVEEKPKQYENVMHDITSAGNIQTNTLDPEIINLLHALSDIHGPVRVTREAGGIHANIADPELLEVDGRRELNYENRHLAINLEKYLGLGKWKTVNRPRRHFNMYNEEGDLRSALCMKTGKTYTVTELLQMPPLEKRGLSFANVEVSREISGSVASKRLIDDGNGNLIPEPPGTVVPITQLPETHPAVQYLLRRGFDLPSLERQFNCGYCTQELPESRAEARYYRRLGGGMKDTPQGRIILDVRVHGVRTGWQARIIDHTDYENGNYYVFHPYTNTWECAKRRDAQGNWHVLPAFQDKEGDFKPSKYKNAAGSARSKMLMGYDAALEYMRDSHRKTCVLVEGPLDAGKIGAPAIAILGKFLSRSQAEIIENDFKKILVVADADSAGREMLQSVRKAVTSSAVIPIQLPPGVKDAGDLTIEAARSLITPYL